MRIFVFKVKGRIGLSHLVVLVEDPVEMLGKCILTGWSKAP